MANSEQDAQVQGRAVSNRAVGKARRTALIAGLIALAIYAGFLLSTAIK